LGASHGGVARGGDFLRPDLPRAGDFAHGRGIATMFIALVTVPLPYYVAAKRVSPPHGPAG
jgi:hypothetical protein